MLSLNRATVLKLTQPKTRIILGTIVALVAWFLSNQVLNLEYRFVFLATYDLAVGSYLVLFFIRMGIATEEDTRRISQKQEPSNLWMLGTVISLSLISIVALVGMADTPKNWPKLAYQMHVLLSLFALFLSWIAVHIFFGLHYAQRYYHQDLTQVDQPFLKGLEFPGQEDLVHYWDFIYLAFSIGMCYGTTDVNILSKEMRRITLFHAIFSFIYVLVILGLVVNFISSIV